MGGFHIGWTLRALLIQGSITSRVNKLVKIYSNGDIKTADIV